MPEAKVGKNRMHLDLRVADLDAEVDRLVALGARRRTTDPIEEAGWSWHVLTDPEDNEFCVLRPPS
ncbi:VOC family protein [Actinocatenispora sera]|uniref:VOC family protein n=1 Tax=Actinocatenispora sera TaxID=390989 RepID=UPI0033CAE6E1